MRNSVVLLADTALLAKENTMPLLQFFFRAIAISCLPFFAAVSQAEPILNVNFVLAGGATQSGYDTASDTSGGGSASWSLTAANGDEVALQASTTQATGLGFRYRNTAVTGGFATLSNLLRGELKSANTPDESSADTLKLTLSGLSAGTYEMTTYHHGTTHASASAFGGPFHLLVDGSQVNGDYTHTFGTSPDTITTIDFQFIADGVNPVAIEFVEPTAATREIVINGFELSAVPEPSALAIILTGAVLGLIFMWRHRN